MVVEAPHPGLFLDALSLAAFAAEAACIARDADLYVDRLVEGCEARGATVLVSHVSRYVVDLNRAEGDHDGQAVQGSRGHSNPHGVVWHRTTDGQRCLEAPLSELELRRRLDAYHRPYHAALRELLDETKARFGTVVLVCAHSMPSEGRGLDGDTSRRADVVPGTRERTSAHGALIDEADRTIRRLGFSVAHDDPYKGGFSTSHYGRPREGVSAIQIEIARRLYMSERTFVASEPGVARVQGLFGELVEVLGARALAGPG